MKMTFRWYGKDRDPLTLQQIEQIPGMTGIMGLLDYKAAGEVWTDEECKEYIDGVHAAGLECEVIESVNVHEDIKMGLPTRDKYIENYITTIRNLAKYGVKVIVYNFMPVFDWLRTDLARVIEEDGSNSLYFDEKELGNMTPLDIVKKTAEDSHGFTLPGWEPERLAELEKTLKQYEGITPDMLRENYKYFLDAIIPVCEEVGVKMAVHPDDPAWPVFGLSRIITDKEHLLKLMKAVDAPFNGVTLCTGSLGSNPENDIPDIIRSLKGRIHFAHVRNLQYNGYRDFQEAAHLSADGSMDMYEIMKALYDIGFDGIIRPDHGRAIWGEVSMPGYGLYDRALGACYLNGLWEAIVKQNGNAHQE